MWESLISSPSAVQGKALATDAFICILSSKNASGVYVSRYFCAMFPGFG